MKKKKYAYIRKEKKYQINNVSFHLKNLEKEEQNKLKANWWKKIIKIRAEINEIENRKTVEKINETKSWFFKKINIIDKPLANWQKKRENYIRNETGERTPKG